MHFGDYPNGKYWSAQRLPIEGDEPADYTVSGSVIRLMWDYGVIVPLWDAEGLLPGEPDWLRETLGLSDPLIEDLTTWGRLMEELDANPHQRSPTSYDALNSRGQDLANRLQQEVGSRYTVEYRPW